MKLSKKIEAAYTELRQACENLCDVPTEPRYWQDLCVAKGRIVALLNCAKRAA